MVFLHGIHLKDNFLVYIGLSKLYGVGLSTAISICKKLLIPSQIRFSQLSPSQVSSLNQYLSSLVIESNLKLVETKYKKKLEMMHKSNRKNG